MPLALAYRVEALPLREPFQIAGRRFVDVPVLKLRLRDGPYEGLGEAAGVCYVDDRPPGMARRVETVRAAIEAGGFDRQWLRGSSRMSGNRDATTNAERKGRQETQRSQSAGISSALFASLCVSLRTLRTLRSDIWSDASTQRVPVDSGISR